MPVIIQDKQQLERDLHGMISQLEADVSAFICFERAIKRLRLDFLKVIKRSFDTPDALKELLENPPANRRILDGRIGVFVQTRIIPSLITMEEQSGLQLIFPPDDLLLGPESPEAAHPVQVKKTLMSPLRASNNIYPFLHHI